MNKERIKHSANYNTEFSKTVLSPSTIKLTETLIQVYDSEGKLRVQMNRG